MAPVLHQRRQHAMIGPSRIADVGVDDHQVGPEIFIVVQKLEGIIRGEDDRVRPQVIDNPFGDHAVHVLVVHDHDPVGTLLTALLHARQHNADQTVLLVSHKLQRALVLGNHLAGQGQPDHQARAPLERAVRRADVLEAGALVDDFQMHLVGVFQREAAQGELGFLPAHH